MAAGAAEPPPGFECSEDAGSVEPPDVPPTPSLGRRGDRSAVDDRHASESDSGSQGRRAEQATDAGDEHRPGTPLSTSGTLDMIPLAMSGMLATLWALLTSQGKAYVRTDRTAILSPVGEGRVGALQLLIPGTAGKRIRGNSKMLLLRQGGVMDAPANGPEQTAADGTPVAVVAALSVDGALLETKMVSGEMTEDATATQETDGVLPGQMVEMSLDGSAIRETYELSQVTSGKSETRGSHEGTIMEASFGFPGQMVEMSLDGSAIRETDTADGMILGQLMGTIVGGTPVPMLFVRAGMEKTEMTGGGSGEHQRSSRSPCSRPRTQKTSEGARAPISAR